MVFAGIPLKVFKLYFKNNSTKSADQFNYQQNLEQNKPILTLVNTALI